jgi:hypothetical protein
MTARSSIRLSVLITTLAVACAPLNGVREPPNGEGQARDTGPGMVVVHVQNQNTTQATLFMIEDEGMGRRLGEVPALSDRFFERELWGARNVRFEVRLLAGPTYRTASVPAIPGDTIQVTIPPRR